MAQFEEIKAVLFESFLSLLKNLVDFPDEVVLHITAGDYSTIFVQISAREGDVGKIIGKEGAHADCIRRLMSAIGSKYRHRIIVEINPCRG